MKRFALIPLMLSLGQGCPGPQPEPVIGPTDVTDALRAACPYDSDADIHAGLILVDAARQDGASKLDALSALSIAMCTNAGAEMAACNRCAAEVVEHVWSH